MIDWLLSIFRNYWPAILILLGIGYLIYGFFEDEIFVGILLLAIFSGLGILFFIYTPAEVWGWLWQLGLVKFLFDGAWYEITLKVTGAIAATGMALRILIIGLRK